MRQKPDDNLIGESPAFLEVIEHVSRAAPLNRPLVIIGERGTGKELIAARAHYLSQRWGEPYIKLNCGALSDSLLESELFGHEAGSFTGASKLRKGRFELAHEGSLFLDELGNMPMNVQEKLLRVLEYGEFERLGGQRSVRVDVRIIAATQEDLPSLAERGEFRCDLLDRLAFDVITIPPLRHRQEDILPLARHFAQRMAAEIGLALFPGFSSEAEDQLCEYRWPGNVRELKNVVERAVYRCLESEQPIGRILFDPFASPYRPEASGSQGKAGRPSAPNGPTDLKQTVQDFEIDLITRALEATRFNQRQAAEYLGVTYHQLRGYLRKYDLC